MQDTIYVIGAKWKLPIIHSICKGNKRFTDIRHSIPGITKRMLSRSLKELEDNKLIAGNVDPDFASMIEYKFPQYILEYGNLILEMIRWGENDIRPSLANLPSRPPPMGFETPADIRSGRMGSLV